MFNILVFLASLLPYLAVFYLLVFIIYRLIFSLINKLEIKELLKVTLIPFSIYFIYKYYKKQKLYFILVIIGFVLFLLASFAYWYVRYK